MALNHVKKVFSLSRACSRKFPRTLYVSNSLANSEILPKKETQVTNEAINPLDHEDYFHVNKLINMKQLFDARVHLGHHEGTWDPLTRPYIYGMRSTQHIIDLEKTVECLQCALNVLSHVVYRRGVVLFMSTNPRFDFLIQKTARTSGEYFVTRGWHKGMFNNAHKMLGTDRLPDLIIAFNLSRFERIREAVKEAAMCNIPVIGIIDTDCDPRLITYPIPGNDDTTDSVALFCDILKQTILNAKEKLSQDEEAKDTSKVIELNTEDIENNNQEALSSSV